MRWAMFILSLYFTVPIVMLVPWCGFTSKEAYRNMVVLEPMPEQSHAETNTHVPKVEMDMESGSI